MARVKAGQTWINKRNGRHVFVRKVTKIPYCEGPDRLAVCERTFPNTGEIVVMTVSKLVYGGSYKLI